MENIPTKQISNIVNYLYRIENLLNDEYKEESIHLEEFKTILEETKNKFVEEENDRFNNKM